MYGGEFIGEDNFHNPASLDWVLQAMQYPIFGTDLYPTLAKKSAILAWTIISGHVFFDGNKRTGLFTSLKFLELNHYSIDVPYQTIMQIALDIATFRENKFTVDIFSEWLENNMKVIRKTN